MVDLTESDKRSSLLIYEIDYDRERFYGIGPRGQYNTSFYERNLRILVIS